MGYINYAHLAILFFSNLYDEKKIFVKSVYEISFTQNFIFYIFIYIFITYYITHLFFIFYILKFCILHERNKAVEQILNIFFVQIKYL